MEVNLRPEVEAKIGRLAAELGREPADVVEEVLVRYFDEESRFVEAVALGEEALGRGEFLRHEEVGERLKRFLSS